MKEMLDSNRLAEEAVEDMQSCGNYSGIKLLSHSKLWEKVVVEGKLRSELRICEQQYSSIATGQMFALRILLEKVRRRCIVSL